MMNIINFLAIFFQYVIDFLIIFIFLRVILSWFPIPRSKFTAFLQEMTNPLFRIVRKFPYYRIGVLDLTPIWAYLVLELLSFLVREVFLKLGANPSIYFVS